MCIKGFLEFLFYCLFVIKPKRAAGNHRRIQPIKLISKD
jgi:hypothetical protein